MKEFIKTRKISKKISLILMSILLFLLGIMITNESKAVYVNELWDQSTINGKPYDIYCIEPTNPLSNDSSNYRVTTTWTVNGNSVKKNNVAVNSNTSEYKLALKRAYILSTSDTLFTRNQMDTVLKSWKNPYPSTAKRALFNGIYDVTSVKQAAVWKLSGFNKWKNFGSYLKYEWDVGGTVVNFVIRRSKIGSQWHYTYTTDNGGYSEGAFKGVGGNYGMTALNFKSEIDYYTRAENLYNAAISYKGEPTVSLKTEGMSSIQPDYTSDSSYVKIGPYVLEHNSRVTIQTTVDSATDLEGRNIKDKIILSTETIKDKLGNITGTKITIKISKNNMPTSIGKIKIKYTAKNVVTNATIYEVKNTIDGGQNLLSGGGTLQNIDRTIEIPSELTLIPPIKLNLTKKSSLGSNLSGVKFKIEAKQNGSVIAEKNGITSFTTVSGGKTLNWQPTSRDYPIIITITETDVPTGYKVAEPIVITLTYDTTTNKWKATKTTDKENILTITKDTNIDITITNQYISPIKIGGDIDGFGGFDKVDQAEKAVIGAEFKAVFEQDGKELATKTATSNTAGKLDFEAVQPKTTSNVRVTITETKAPAGYENSGYAKTIDFKYNTKKHTWEPLTNDVHAKVQYKNKTTYVDIDNVVNKSQIDKLTLIKRDSQDSSKLTGAKFRITLSNIEKIKKYNIASDPANIEVEIQDGELTLEELVIKDVNKPVIITLEETLAPKGYKKIDGKITVKITRVGTEYTITTSSEESVTSSEFFADTVTIKGNKGDVNRDGDIAVNDALLVLQYSTGEITLDEDQRNRADTNGDGRINSADALWILQHKTKSVTVSAEIINAIEKNGKGDINDDKSITTEDALLALEIAVGKSDPNIKKPENGDVDGNGKVNSADALAILQYLARGKEAEDTTTGVTENNHKIEIRMNDIPIMNLGGIVWAEKIKAGKEQADINNTYSESDDEALGGVTVRLLDENDKTVATTKTAEKDGQEVTYLNNLGKEGTVKLKQGQYLFTKLDDGTNYIPVGTDYKVEIDYDGITYNPLINPDTSMLYKNKEDNKGVFSKITSEEDHGLADGTKTIFGTENETQSKTNGGYTINYTLQDEENIPDKAIYSNVEKDGKQAFVTARSEKYLQKTDDWKTTWKDNNGVGEINLDSYAFDINFGLYKKFFDLNLGTDVDSAEVLINGQTSTYTYDQILDGELDRALRNESQRTTDDAIDYNLYLAYSDYNYRIADYKVPGDEGSLGNPYGDSITSKKDKDTELEVYVTYNLQINNQSTQHNAERVKVKYSYDEGYKYVESNGEVEDIGKNMLEISNINVAPGEKKTIQLTFKVKKNENDGTFVKDPKAEETYTNMAEIIEYSTKEGRLVDADSAPGNTFLGENKPTTRREDDTDTANGIVIRFKENAERSISGKVFDASNNNGVSDVIVQLIELVEINNQQYEYIWQETVAGSDTVKTTARNGYSGDSYNVTNEAGEYKFTERIIPGNYIVRFIYGDGSTYDITNNTLKYNGEDYKSTYVNYNYNADWYNDTSLNGENSKAVDNEARRLKVMSYAVDVDGAKGKKLALLNKQANNLTEAEKASLKDDVLANTWMCAETLKIKVPVDADTQKNTNADTTVADGSNPNIGNTQFTNVNFGLMERPKTKLVLEKHITGLTIKPVESGVRLIADARANIEDILNNVTEGQIRLEGEQTGLLAIKSTRSNRGYWYLQTDTTELAQGADAYITYTYVITNKGDKDYLSNGLIEAYRENEGTIDGTQYNYQNYLENLETLVKDKIKAKGFTKGEYLSKFYYTRDETEATPVLASVESMQEFLNPKVSFVSGDNMMNNTTGESKPYYTTNGTLENQNITEKVTSNSSTGKLVRKGDDDYNVTETETKNKNTDWSKKAVVSKALSASEIETGGVYDSYLAEITHYTNAAGRRDQSTPANLSYVHSEDKNMNMESYKDSNGNMITAETTITVAGSTITEETNYYLYGATVKAEGVEVSSSDIKLEKDKLTYVGRTFNDLNNTTFEKLNEEDEFWAETFRITKPTGEDKLTPVQIAIITISSVAVLGVGIILIKKFVLKK